MRHLFSLIKKFSGGSYCIASLIILLAFNFLPSVGHTQVVTESAKKKVTIGVGEFTDFWMNTPATIKTRGINQGFNVFGTYNVPFGKSNFSFAIGLGLTVHNMYGNFLVNIKSDSTYLTKIPDGVNYKRSKLDVTYLEIPLEFRYKDKNKVVVGVGFKGGIEIASATKYLGNGPVTTYNYTVSGTEKTKIKMSGIKNLEQFTYGPTLRIGYSWFNLTASYMLSSIFQKGRGPQVYPISAGISFIPF